MTRPRKLSSAAAATVLGAVLGIGLTTGPAHACTTFILEGAQGPLVGKSYDWSVGEGVVLFNKKDVAKRALALDPGDRPAVWTSRYASLTFNQYGRELPNGGMNSAGLVVEVMWLGSTEYPEPDGRPTVNELQWIQFQLDSYARVAEVVSHADDLRISGVHGKVHYMACDRTGDCAAIEHLDGRAIVSAGADMPVKALTNNTYAESVAYLRRYRGFGGAQEAPSGSGSLARFVRTAVRVSGIIDGDLEATALASLDDVRSGSFTKWNIVYDPQRLKVHFRTSTSPVLKTVHMSSFDSSCATPVRMLDIDHDGGGDISDVFVDYSPAANAAAVERTLSELGVDLPRGATDLLIGLPETTRCREIGGPSIAAATAE